MTQTLDPARQQLYKSGRTAVFAHTPDPRFSYCLYVPPPDPTAPPPGLIVTIHHSLRNFMQCRDSFAEIGERMRQVVLAPLFPINVQGDGNPDGYKYLIEGDIHYDRLLNEMVDASARMTGCDGRRFCLYGYSGGGHFTHRYMMVHPERVIAASIGAPGQVTLLDPEADWWLGVRDLEALFGRALNSAALRKVAVQLIIGADDTETWEISHAPGSRYWRATSAQPGSNRIERMHALKRSLEAAGLSVQLDVMPGVKHFSIPSMALAQAFFERRVENARPSATPAATRSA